MLKAFSYAANHSTIPEKHKGDPFILLLKRNGTYCAVGALGQILGYNNQEMIMKRRTLTGSPIGSMAEAQEMLDFYAEHDIALEVQVIPIQEVNESY